MGKKNNVSRAISDTFRFTKLEQLIKDNFGAGSEMELKELRPFYREMNSIRNRYKRSRKFTYILNKYKKHFE